VRLSSILCGRPKFLLDVVGRPIISYAIGALAAAGVREFVVVVPAGWSHAFASRVAGLFRGVEFTVIENRHVDRGNGYSFALTGEHVEDAALLSMCDHIYTPEIPRALLSSYRPGGAVAYVAGDSRADYVDVAEATRIRAGREGLVEEIGKGIADFNYIDTGVFIVTRKLYSVADELASSSRVVEFSQVIAAAVKRGYPVKLVDVTSMPWTEVDTPEDLRELLLGRRAAVLSRVLPDIQIGAPR